MLNYHEINKDSIKYFPVAERSELSNGDRLFVEIGDVELVMFNVADTIFAIGDVCSHDEGPLGDGDIEGMEVVCPRHGAHFDIRTGEATELPAVEDIPAYPVRINEGQIEVGIPIEELE